MGRKKTLDRDEVLSEALKVFREHGFAGTSAEMLVSLTGISRHSLYADFGSMMGLYEATLQKYNDDVIDQRFGLLEGTDSQLADLLELFDFYAGEGTSNAKGLGCLLCNMAIEFGANDPTRHGAISNYFKRISGAIENTLNNAKNEGEIGADIQTRTQADYLTASIMGLFVMIRADVSRQMISNVAEAAKTRILDLAQTN